MKRVLLVDLVSWSGHHKSYFLLYTKILLELGYQVDTLCLGNDEVKVRFADDISKGKLSIIHVKLSLIQRIWLQIHRILPLPIAAKITLDIHTLARWLVIKNALRKISADENTFVFLLDLQGYLSDIQPYIQKWILPNSWAGLYVCPPPINILTQNKNQQRQLINHPSMKALCLLNEHMVTKIEKELQRPFAIHLPDVSYTQCQTSRPRIISDIKNDADGRKVVLLASLTKKHGLLNFLKLLEFMHDSPILFCAIGLVVLDGYTSEEKIYIDRVLSSPPENLFVLPGFYPEEETLNSIYQVVDAAFICYENFDHSSNKLTKAICLGTPVLVKVGTLLADRVNKYNLGYAVNPSDLEQTSNYLELLLNNFRFNETSRKAFIDCHSEQTLKIKLADLIQ